MQIQFNTDHSVQGSQEFAAEVEAGLRTSLGHLTSHLTRIEVHLSDENGGKGGDSDKQCELEARMAGRQPLSVTDSAATFHQAIHGATVKLKHALQHVIGKMDSNRHGDVPNP
ncbi:MAG: HPF/RaiA family ribosome-associated protein [Herminiimonas sp.]|nr:HPF/RaiA family ribosome-associated protein [Herminiimonas sp.]